MTGQDIGDEAAFARPYSTNEEGWHKDAQTGLTKREWLAGLAMQGLLAGNIQFKLVEKFREKVPDENKLADMIDEAIAQACCLYADALLAELAKEEA